MNFKNNENNENNSDKILEDTRFLRNFKINEKNSDKILEDTRYLRDFEESFGGTYKKHRFYCNEKCDIDTFLNGKKADIKNTINDELSFFKSAKILTTLAVNFRKDQEFVNLNDIDKENYKTTTETTIIDKYFRSDMVDVFEASDLDEILEKMFAGIKKDIENSNFPSSGFTFIKK